MLIFGKTHEQRDKILREQESRQKQSRLVKEAKRKAWREKVSIPHKWFALLPVQLDTGKCAMFGFVERTFHPATTTYSEQFKTNVYEPPYFSYRLIDK